MPLKIRETEKLVKRIIFIDIQIKQKIKGFLVLTLIIPARGVLGCAINGTVRRVYQHPFTLWAISISGYS